MAPASPRIQTPPRTPRLSDQGKPATPVWSPSPSLLHPDFLTPQTLVSTLRAALATLSGAPAAQAAALGRSPLFAAFLDHALALAEAQCELHAVDAEAARMYRGGVCQHPGAAKVCAVHTHAGADPEPSLLVLELLACAGCGAPGAAAAQLELLYHRAAAALGEACDAAMRGCCTDVPAVEPLLSPEQCVRQAEAAAATCLPVHALRSRGLGLMLRYHLQRRRLSPAQALRLLRAWAAGLPAGAGRRRSARPTADDWRGLCACLCPERLSASDLAGAAAAAAAFPAPAVDSMPLLRALADEAVRRAAGPAPLLPPATAARVLAAVVESAEASSARLSDAMKLHIAMQAAEAQLPSLEPAEASGLRAAAAAAAALMLEHGPITPNHAAAALVGAWAAMPAQQAESAPAVLPAAAALASLALAVALAAGPHAA